MGNPPFIEVRSVKTVVDSDVIIPPATKRLIEFGSTFTGLILHRSRDYLNSAHYGTSRVALRNGIRGNPWTGGKNA